MAEGRHRYLVAYDIGDSKRLRQVHKKMKAFGWPMQYSVFICDLDSVELYGLLGDLGALIHHGSDAVAIIDLGSPTERGRSCFRFLGKAKPLPTTGTVII